MFGMVPFGLRNNASKRKESLERIMDYMFEQPLGPLSKVSSVFSSFKVDVKDCGNSYEILAELPGLDRENIVLDYDKNYLSITANRNEDREEHDEDGKYICRERHSSKMERSFYIDDIDESKIKAELKEGILKVVLPKNSVEEIKKTIPIE